MYNFGVEKVIIQKCPTKVLNMQRNLFIFHTEPKNVSAYKRIKRRCILLGAVNANEPIRPN